MRIEELERAVNGLLDQFGDRALHMALKRAGNAAARDARRAATHWGRIADLLRKRPSGASPLSACG